VIWRQPKRSNSFSYSSIQSRPAVRMNALRVRANSSARTTCSNIGLMRDKAAITFSRSLIEQPCKTYSSEKTFELRACVRGATGCKMFRIKWAAPTPSSKILNLVNPLYPFCWLQAVSRPIAAYPPPKKLDFVCALYPFRKRLNPHAVAVKALLRPRCNLTDLRSSFLIGDWQNASAAY
jgi:hypothetical protein